MQIGDIDDRHGRWRYRNSFLTMQTCDPGRGLARYLPALEFEVTHGIIRLTFVYVGGYSEDWAGRGLNIEGFSAAPGA